MKVVFSSLLLCASTTCAANTLTAPTTTATPVAQTSEAPKQTEVLSPQAEVQLLVLDAMKYIQENGPELALKEFNSPDGKFTKPHTYIFALDFKGNMLAHGGDINLVGKNHYDIKDSKGRSVVRALIEKARYSDGAWVSYYWKNPLTQAEECKSSFVTAIDKKIVVGAGFHHTPDEKGTCQLKV